MPCLARAKSGPPSRGGRFLASAQSLLCARHENSLLSSGELPQKMAQGRGFRTAQAHLKRKFLLSFPAYREFRTKDEFAPDCVRHHLRAALLSSFTRRISMNKRQLGSSDLFVSDIALGSWLTYGVGVEADAARRCLDTAFDEGINFVDTANVYGNGAAESFLGQALKDRPRDSYVLATKAFFPMDADNRGLSRAQIEKQLDASLKRLNTDLRRSLPGASLRRGDPARGDDGGAHRGGEGGQDALHRLLRMDRAADPGRARPRRIGGGGEVRFEPAAIQPAVARSRGRGHPDQQGQRHFADRLVAARAGRADGQICARRAPAARAAARPATRWAATSAG